MRAVILAAGQGRRLQASGYSGPKCLLEFEGVSLIERHLRCLGTLGIEDIRICVGYQADLIRTVLNDSPFGKHVATVSNEDYELGSVVSLWCMRDELRHHEDVILMDADVLYTPVILERLVTSHVRNCFLLDRDYEAGDEPVKLCINDNQLVEFRKQITSDLEYTDSGESIGFFRFAPEVAERLATQTETYIESGRRDAPYEDAIRDLLLDDPGQFGYEDVTGLPWIEIDFPEDVALARDEILPAIHGR